MGTGPAITRPGTRPGLGWCGGLGLLFRPKREVDGRRIGQGNRVVVGLSLREGLGVDVEDPLLVGGGPPKGRVRRRADARARSPRRPTVPDSPILTSSEGSDTTPGTRDRIARPESHTRNFAGTVLPCLKTLDPSASIGWRIERPSDARGNCSARSAGSLLVRTVPAALLWLASAAVRVRRPAVQPAPGAVSRVVRGRGSGPTPRHGPSLARCPWPSGGKPVRGSRDRRRMCADRAR